MVNNDDKQYLRSLTVLYVEDNEDARRQVVMFLSRIAGTVLTAENGAQGLQIYNRAKPDIVVTDIQMPIMDGLKMASEIRDEDETTPIIVLTAFDQGDYLMKAINIGIDTYVTKPVDQFRLQSALVRSAHRLLAEKVFREKNILLDTMVFERTAELQHSNDQLRQLATQIEALVETERKELAREIHQEIGQHLTILESDMAWLKKQNLLFCSVVNDRIQSMCDRLEATVKSIGKINNDLYVVLDEVGIVAAIESQIEEVYREKVACDLEVFHREIPVQRERSLSLFRIFQQAMGNVLRHSGATMVNISLDISAERVILKVTDNGCGISDSKNDDPDSRGLLGMYERALRWGGEVIVHGIPGRGTVVEATIPMKGQT